jgi:hypothetical protein
MPDRQTQGWWSNTNSYASPSNEARDKYLMINISKIRIIRPGVHNCVYTKYFEVKLNWGNLDS